MSQLQVPVAGKGAGLARHPRAGAPLRCRGRAAPGSIPAPRGPFCRACEGLAAGSGNKGYLGAPRPAPTALPHWGPATGSHDLRCKTKETIVTREAPARLPPPPSPHRAPPLRGGPGCPAGMSPSITSRRASASLGVSPGCSSGDEPGSPVRDEEPRLPVLRRIPSTGPALPVEGRSEPALCPCPCGTKLRPVPLLGAVPSAPSPRERTESSHTAATTARALQTHMKGPAPALRGYGPSQSHTETTPQIREATSLPCIGEFVKCLQITLSDHTGTEASDTSLVIPLPGPSPGGTPRVCGGGLGFLIFFPTTVN